MVTTMMCAAVISHQMVLCWRQLLTTRGLLSGIHTLAQNCWNFGIYSFIICFSYFLCIFNNLEYMSREELDLWDYC